MNSVEPWIRDALTDEVAETIREYIWSDVIRWLAAEGYTSFDAHCDTEVLKRLNLIDLVIAGDTVQSMWDSIRDEIDTELATTARRVVPNEVVERWLVRESEQPRNEKGDPLDALKGDPEGGYSVDSIMQAFGIVADDPDRQVLKGLRLLASAKADRDLADQLGVWDDPPLPEWLKWGLPASQW